MPATDPRAEVLAALFRRANGRPVWAIDGRGRGGKLRPGAESTDGFLRSVPGSHGEAVRLADVVLVCVEGDPVWVRLPEVLHAD